MKKSLGKEIFNPYQVSMTEWYASLGKQKKAEVIRYEDNTKDERLEVLFQTIGLEYERPTDFEATALLSKDKEFVAFLKSKKNELCALRLIPKEKNLPKLRSRGLSVNDVFTKWFPKQKIDAKKYIASFRPHAGTYPLSIILVVNKKGIFGQTVVGQHAQLSQGETKRQTTEFVYKFGKWEWRNKTTKSERVIKDIVKSIQVLDLRKRQTLSKKINAKFTHNFLEGYYEAILWKDGVIRFSDFNRLLYKDISLPNLDERKGLSGVSVYKGKIKGRVGIISSQNILKKAFQKGSVLVTQNTDVRFLPLMKIASAILTDKGGLLSHAAIVARELKKPCIIGTKIATKVLKDGDLVEVDAEKGVVRVLKRKE